MKIMVARVFLHQEVIQPIIKKSVIGIVDFVFFEKNWLHVLEFLKLISMISSKRKYSAYISMGSEETGSDPQHTKYIYLKMYTSVMPVSDSWDLELIPNDFSFD